jgi:preprotein translocase subunit SecG
MKNVSNNIQEEILDAILFMIKSQKNGVRKDELFEQNYADFKAYSISRDSLEYELQFLISDKKIFLDDSDTYNILPSAMNFSGYVVQKAKEQIKKRNEKYLHIFFNSFTIISATFFGVVTIFFNYLTTKQGDNVNKLSNEIKSINIRLDSLEKVVTYNKIEKINNFIRR